MIDAVRGLARNPAAPPEVLLRLLEVAPEAAAEGLERRADLPLPVQEAMLRHSSRRVRGTLARHPRIDPGLREQLLFGPDAMLAAQAFGRPGQPPLSDDVLSRLLLRIEDAPGELMSPTELWGKLVQPGASFLRPYRIAATHADPRVRAHAVGVASGLDEASQAALLADPVPEIRVRTAEVLAEARRPRVPADLPDHHCHGYWWVLRQPLSRALVDQVLAGGHRSELDCLAANSSTPPDVVETLLGHPEGELRRTLATRPDLTEAQLLRLAADTDAAVRTAVSVHPGLTEEQRAGIAIDVTTVDGDGHYGPRHLCPEYGERAPALPDALRWARSVNPPLRRRAARHPELPPDLVTALAGDPDHGVRVLLAQHHPGAPPALLLRSYLDYTGCGRDRLTELPGFPVEGSAALGVPRLVALDPRAPGEFVERLLGDPDPEIRRLMAACPRLPVARIEALLGRPELAEPAAANPALPADRMARIARAVGS